MIKLVSYGRSWICRCTALIAALIAAISLSGCVLEIPPTSAVEASSGAAAATSLAVQDANPTNTIEQSEEDELESQVQTEISSTDAEDKNGEGGTSEGVGHVSQAATNTEQPVILLPLPEMLSSSNLEISAMDWFGDHLILVPQYPERFGNQLFAIDRQQILDTLDGTRTRELDVMPVPFNSGLLRLRIPRFYGGFEAIAFSESRVYLTVEAGLSDDMVGYIVAGDVAPDLSQIVLDYEHYTEIASPTGIGNLSEEALVLNGQELLTIYEANGVNVNSSPVVHRVGANLAYQGTLPMPNIEYRITDATDVDENGRFWAINYLYPGDEELLVPYEPEPLAAQFGKGATHQSLRTVERLVEFQIDENGISLTGTPPIQLELFGGNIQVLGRNLGDEIPRNWEGIVRLDNRGFLIATDKFPDTLLGFVPFPK